MKVAEITTYKEGGAYTHVVELVKNINADIIIITGNTRKIGYQKENGNLYYHVPLLKSIWDVFFINPPGSYQIVEKILKERKVELVHFHSPLFTFLYGFLRKKKFPLIMTTHYLLDVKLSKGANVIYISFIKWMTRFIAKNVNKIICVNEDYIPIFKSGVLTQINLFIFQMGSTQRDFHQANQNLKIST
jgi:glycosyltransferase involved in cell wall biosynthesis